MKVVHLKKENIQTDDIAAEINQWELILKVHPTNDKAYNRLMILHRKQRNYKEELKTINRAINTFEEFFKKRQPKFSTKIKSLSTALAKALKLSDKKGNSLYLMGDLSKWKKRKELVRKKITSA